CDTIFPGVSKVDCVCVFPSTEPRDAPSEVKASSISSKEIKVTWRQINPGPGRPRGYEVSYRKDSEQEESGKKKKTAGNETSMVLTGLEGNSVYVITVRGFNSIGQGPASTANTAKTKKDPPVQPPANLMWIQEGTNVSLNWEPVKSKDNESDVIGYKVRPPYNTLQPSQLILILSRSRCPGSIIILSRSRCPGSILILSRSRCPGSILILSRSRCPGSILILSRSRCPGSILILTWCPGSMSILTWCLAQYPSLPGVLAQYPS
ncbi:unnamed protein product, partial [Oncorhynchus mykiss]